MAESCGRALQRPLGALADKSQGLMGFLTFTLGATNPQRVDQEGEKALCVDLVGGGGG